MGRHPPVTIAGPKDVIIDIQPDKAPITAVDVSTETNIRSVFKAKTSTMIIYVLIAVALIGGTAFGVYTVVNESGYVPRDDTSTFYTVRGESRDASVLLTAEPNHEESAAMSAGRHSKEINAESTGVFGEEQAANPKAISKGRGQEGSHQDEEEKQVQPAGPIIFRRCLVLVGIATYFGLKA